MTFHQSAKSELKELAKYVRITLKNDKPGQREVINNRADSLSREYFRHYSEKQTAYLTDCLHSYAANLHP